MSLGVLPFEWVEAKIGNLIDDMVGGLSPKTTDYQDNGIVALNKGDIKQYGALKLKSSPNYLSKSFIGDKSNKIIDKGDVLVTLRDLSQKADFLGLIALYEVDQPAVITQGMYKLILNKALDRKYLMWYSNSPCYRSQVKREKVGATQVHLRNEQFESLRFPLPSLAEQQVIVETLDNLLIQLESIKTRLERIPEILKKFRQSVLAAAVSGKLTEECEIDDWQSMTIGEVAEVRTGKTPSRTESKYWDNGIIPWLTSSVTGLDYCFNADEFISEIASKECNLKPFPIGTLLLAMYGEGKTRGQVTELKLEATCNQACAAILPNNEIALTSYVKLKLQENYEVIRLAASGGNQPNLNLNKVREIGIQIPTLEVQAKIVHEVDALLKISENINQQVLSALDRINNLTQSILAKAFRGELTAEWREANSELISEKNSAEALLERIKAERELAKPATKRIRGKA